MTEKIAVLGGGSWGATLAGLLAEQGHSVALWEYVPAIAESLKSTRQLATVPDLTLPASVRVTNHMAEALAGLFMDSFRHAFGACALHVKSRVCHGLRCAGGARDQRVQGHGRKNAEAHE